MTAAVRVGSLRASMEDSQLIEVIQRTFPDLYDISIDNITNDLGVVKRLTFFYKGLGQTLSIIDNWKKLKWLINKRINEERNIDCEICCNNDYKPVCCNSCGNTFCYNCYVNIFMAGRGIITCPFCNDKNGYIMNDIQFMISCRELHITKETMTIS